MLVHLLKVQIPMDIANPVKLNIVLNAIHQHLLAQYVFLPILLMMMVLLVSALLDKGQTVKEDALNVLLMDAHCAPLLAI